MERGDALILPGGILIGNVVLIGSSFRAEDETGGGHPLIHRLVDDIHVRRSYKHVNDVIRSSTH